MKREVKITQEKYQGQSLSYKITENEITSSFFNLVREKTRNKKIMRKNYVLVSAHKDINAIVHTFLLKDLFDTTWTELS